MGKNSSVPRHEIWTLLERYKSRIIRVEMSYLQNIDVVLTGETNEHVCERCGVEVDVLQDSTSNTLRRFGHVARIEGERLNKKTHESEVKGRRCAVDHE